MRGRQHGCIHDAVGACSRSLPVEQTWGVPTAFAAGCVPLRNSIVTLIAFTIISFFLHVIPNAVTSAPSIHMFKTYIVMVYCGHMFILVFFLHYSCVHAFGMKFHGKKKSKNPELYSLDLRLSPWGRAKVRVRFSPSSQVGSGVRVSVSPSSQVGVQTRTIQPESYGWFLFFIASSQLVGFNREQWVVESNLLACMTQVKLKSDTCLSLWLAVIIAYTSPNLVL